MNGIPTAESREEFENTINTGDTVVADFFASWCAPCKMQSEVLREFASEVGEKVKAIKVDVDVLGELAAEYGVQSIPTVIVFKNGEPKERSVGLTAKAKLSEMVIKYL